MTSHPEFGSLLPRDEWNDTLLANVHPPDWKNPEPRGRYHLVVVGAGTAGLVTAAIAGSLGARVALVERHLMGGDCLNVGCVPSKAVIAAAKHARARGEATPEGFAEAMRRMREIRARISHEDSAARYTREFGVDVFLGEGRFAGPDVLEVDGRRLRFRRAVIPIGCELAQAFQRLGVRVTLLEAGAHVLEREDPDAAEIVQRALARDGVDLAVGCAIDRVERRGAERVLHLKRADGRAEALAVDEILVAVGRAPNVEGLGLEAAGVAFDGRLGVEVDDRLRTSNRRIFAAGDVCMRWKFTHAADAAAKMVVQNALFGGRRKLSALVMPWCTYTEPEIAHVGLYEREARERGIELDSYLTPMARVNRAATDGEEEGFVKVHVKRGGDRIVGATLVGSHAGELLTPLTLAIGSGLGLGAFANLIYPYPTLAEGLKATAGAYTRTRLTPMVKRLFGLWFRLTG
jgi:pyruvate/2-oxoglutarate dehydrogenase complex dihydrolipoamide dehydrogenase (E3) component